MDELIKTAGFQSGIKIAKNRLAQAIDAAKGTSLDSARRVAALSMLQKRTTQAATQTPGRFKDVFDTVQRQPRLRSAALGLLRDRRI